MATSTPKPKKPAAKKQSSSKITNKQLLAKIQKLESDVAELKSHAILNLPLTTMPPRESTILLLKEEASRQSQIIAEALKDPNSEESAWAREILNGALPEKEMEFLDSDYLTEEGQG
jgi:hypothetical protein